MRPKLNETLPPVSHSRAAGEICRIWRKHSGEAEWISMTVGDAPTMIVPLVAFEQFLDVLDAMARRASSVVWPIYGRVSTEDAAQLLGVTRPTVVSMIERRELSCYKIRGRRYLLLHELHKFLSSQERGRSRKTSLRPVQRRWKRYAQSRIIK